MHHQGAENNVLKKIKKRRNETERGYHYKLVYKSFSLPGE